ncbi:DsbA family protein [Microbacterium karelineae]|uniref:DsbA family protein n=1 Tax=Microbacterium karelineae TaxID=2654283 RepID=UPI0012EAA228|nr:thioredoxin domain-containing protein [Microbacterium karelineae]
MMAAAAKNRSVFAIVVSIAVVVAVVAVGVLVYFMNRTASAPAEAPAAGVVNEETGAIAIGDGDQTIDEYIDFMCPICNQAHEAYGDTITEQIESGEITFNVHPISILDRASQGTEFSTRAAAAAYCVADDNGDAVYPFIDLMFRNQPAEGSTGLTDDEIAGYASDAGADGAASCIADGTYKDYVTERSSVAVDDPDLQGPNGFGTPTVLVNGEMISVTMNADADLVANLD